MTPLCPRGEAAPPSSKPRVNLMLPHVQTPLPSPQDLLPGPALSSCGLAAQLISQFSPQSPALLGVISPLAACLERAFHWGSRRSQLLLIVYSSPAFIWSQQPIRLGF